MKKLILLAFALVALASCKKDEETKPTVTDAKAQEHFDKVKIMR